MADPVTATYAVAALTAAGTVAQFQQSAQVSQQNQDAADINTAEQYRVAAEQERTAAAQASEQMTDRMREARRQLSVARVIDAEGGGSFLANAINIQAADDEDVSRIGASLKNAQSGIRDDMNAIRVAGENSSASIQSQAAAIRTRFLTDTAGAVAGAYVNGERRKAEKVAARNNSADYRVPPNVRVGAS